MKFLSSRNSFFNKNCCGLFLLSFILPSLVGAETLPDPTRPYSAAVPSIVKTGPVLQSILISPSQQVAIINGQRVALGDQYAGTQLVSLSEGEAVLKGQQGLQKLTLFPENKKYLIKSHKQPNDEMLLLNSHIAQQR